MSSFDLIVVGAGIIGASCAEAATIAGLRVCLIDSGPIGGGTTSAGMGHLVCMTGDPAELALSRDSLRQWERFADDADAAFSRCGTLWVASTAQQAATIADQVHRLDAGGSTARAVDASELYLLEPQLAPGLLGGVLVCSEAVVYPPQVARRMVQNALDRGMALHLNRTVRQLRSGGGVSLDDGTRLSGPVLLATGCATPRLLPKLPIRPRKGHLVITERGASLRHQVVEMGYADSAHGDEASSVAFNVQPRSTGQILIGSSRQYGVLDPAVEPDMMRRMLERAFIFMPALRQTRAVRAWTGMRPATPDGRPCLGAMPDHHEVWVACGHEGLGVTTALGSAKLMLDLILQRPTTVDPAPYAPSRLLS